MKDAVTQCLASALLTSSSPLVVFVENYYLVEFIRAVRDLNDIQRFVLVVSSTDDEPLTQKLQDKIASLPGMQACFAMNLHCPQAESLFYPLPIGFDPSRLRNGEHQLDRVKQDALPWAQRDHRLLVTPMADRGILRRQYLKRLRHESYHHLVRVIDGPVNFNDFMRLLGKHQSVLSPIGRGYDCFRTWEALAVGTVPLVVKDAAFDQRLFARTGSAYIPQPEELTPERLSELLSHLQDPGKHEKRLRVGHWKSLWEGHLA